MDLILQKDVKNLGKTGDRVKVKPGYGRNYLLPRGFALTYNENQSRSFKHTQALIVKRKTQAETERAELIKKIKTVSLNFKQNSKEDGTPFGSVNVTDLSKQLEKQGLFVDKRDIKTEALRSFGTHQIKVSLPPDFEAEFKVTIESTKTKEKKLSGFFSKLVSKKETDEPDEPEETDESVKTSLEETSSVETSPEDPDKKD